MRWVQPFAAALALRDEPGLVLLESRPGFGHLSRRSFLAARPLAVQTDGLAALEQTGAWSAGWLSYDLGRQIESLPALARDEHGLPPLALGRYGAHLEFDHVRREVQVRGDGDAAHLLDALKRAPRVRTPDHHPLRRWTSSLSRPAYEASVRRAIDYIRAGDVFQVNLAQRLSTPWSGDPFALYARLRHTSPAPFMALLRLGGADVISASPERFLRRRGTAIETRPIKGTRPRGPTGREDRLEAAELRSSAKDRAENVMIVDLSRNDLGRVARFGSVRVRRLCALERHPGVHHLVSVVDAELDRKVGTTEICAPPSPGSVTGAPKIRAMEIIEELEPVRRGIYCGAIGWISPDDDLDMSVTIRTLVACGGRLSLHVGGAVVADSEPALEWQETMHKAARLLAGAGGELRDPARRPRTRDHASRSGASALRRLRVWLNGALADEKDACISPADHGFLLGDGVFETMRSYSGRLPTLREHLERLAAGARALAIPPPSLDELERGTRELLAASELEDARLRITVTSGSGPPGLRRGEGPPTVLITAAPLHAWPPTATAVVAPWPHDERSPLAGIKTTSRVDTVLALAYARERGADEALFLNGRGDVCEATTANVFAVVDRRVATPPLSAGCLAGITRDHVLRVCREQAIEAAEVDLARSVLLEAQELFLTSSTRGVQPLVRVDGSEVGDGAPGEVTRHLATVHAESLERG